MTAEPEYPRITDPRVPGPEICVTRALVERWAREQPDKVFVHFADTGEEWTYAAFRALVIETARGLQTQGVAQGDHVFLWLPNGPEALRLVFAINYLGAVTVPVNTAYKGQLLEHVIENSDAKLALVHTDLLPRLSAVALAKLERAVVVGGAGEGPPGLDIVPYEALHAAGAELEPLARPIMPWDTQSIIYTSGTTGPSKGVLSSYCHLWTNAGTDSWPFITGEDRFLVNLPIFHIGGLGLCHVMFARGGSITFLKQFDTESFWRVCKKTKTTACFLLGVMANFLAKRPPSEEDRDHTVRKAFMVPLAEDIDAFSARFGLTVYTIFNMTEISSPIVSGPNPTALGTCGQKREGVEVRLVDENDCEVPLGEVGEMIVRTDRPWGMNHGYYKNPEATAKAWRNGWFHTGDAFRKDADGNYFFVDRMKDAIRRRGENISSFEVEAEALAHPDIREAAAIGVPSEFSEDEVLVVVAPAEGRSVDPAALFEFLRPRMAHFMLPRFIRVVEDLPKTPTAKVQKVELRKEGTAPGTWDREAAGIKVKRDKIG